MHPTLRQLASKVPPQQFKRGQEGLFGGARVLSGNNIPFSHHKTRRKWFPNAQTKTLFSERLGHMVRVKLTSRVLRTVDKMGGFDRYILDSNTSSLGDAGVRWRIILKQHLARAKPPISSTVSLGTPRALTIEEVEQQHAAEINAGPGTDRLPLPEADIVSPNAAPEPAAAGLGSTIGITEAPLPLATNPPRLHRFPKTMQHKYIRQAVAESRAAARI